MVSGHNAQTQVLTIHSVTNNPAISSSEVTLSYYSSFAQYDTDGMMASINGDLA